MVFKQKLSSRWLKVTLLALAGIFTMWTSAETRAATTDQSQRVSVSVTASVALSDYFANLLATESTVEAKRIVDRDVAISIHIRSTDGLVFSKHPLRIDVVSDTTVTTIMSFFTQSGQGGRVTYPITLPDRSGYYTFRVTDLAYHRPIVLEALPVLYFLTEADRHTTASTTLSSVARGHALEAPTAPDISMWFWPELIGQAPDTTQLNSGNVLLRAELPSENSP